MSQNAFGCAIKVVIPLHIYRLFAYWCISAQVVA